MNGRYSIQTTRTRNSRAIVYAHHTDSPHLGSAFCLFGKGCDAMKFHRMRAVRPHVIRAEPRLWLHPYRTVDVALEGQKMFVRLLDSRRTVETPAITDLFLPVKR